MQRQRLDLLQFHAWNYADPSYLDGLAHLRALREEGLIAHLGLTNVDSAHLKLLLESGIPIAANQICYSLLDQRARGRMTKVCEAHGVKILAFGTLAGGFLTDRWLGKDEPTELQTWSQMKYKRFIDQAGGWSVFQQLLAVLDDIARRLGVSIANVATRAILDAPSVGGVIVGARLGQSAHIEDNLRIFETALDESARSALNEALEAFTPIPGDCGDEYRKPPFLTASGDLSHHLERFPAPFEIERSADGRTRALSGTVWEDLAGFSRAIRVGDRVLVSGTTATHRDERIGGTDPYAQAVFCLDKIEGAIQTLGGTIDDVIRTRIYVADKSIWEPVSRAHGERFVTVRPANTLVQAELIGEGYLVEITASASISTR
ncbi:MAG: aldo/keto reductase, partial [Myxococcota bacterium]